MRSFLDPLWEALYFGRETNPQCPFSWALDPKVSKGFRRMLKALALFTNIRRATLVHLLIFVKFESVPKQIVSS